MHSQKMPPTISIATDKAVPAGGAIANTVICWPDNVMVVCAPGRFFGESSLPRAENVQPPWAGPLAQTSLFIDARIHRQVVYKNY